MAKKDYFPTDNIPYKKRGHFSLKLLNLPIESNSYYRIIINKTGRKAKP